MDISNYNIEQCDAPSVLAAILDIHDSTVVNKAIGQLKDLLQGHVENNADGYHTKTVVLPATSFVTGQQITV